jgi:antitoxin (DNA-binding transcriptional repressor) of toxin-antitoxin stability system
MGTINAAEFINNISQILDYLEFGGEEITIIRNHHKIARLIPGSPHQTAEEAMKDIYNIISSAEADEWLKDSRMSGYLSEEMRDTWDYNEKDFADIHGLDLVFFAKGHNE